MRPFVRCKYAGYFVTVKFLARAPERQHWRRPPDHTMTDTTHRLTATVTTTDADFSDRVSSVSSPAQTDEGFVHESVPYDYELNEVKDGCLPAEMLEVAIDEGMTTVEWDARDATRRDLSVEIPEEEVTAYYNRLEEFLQTLALIDGTDWTTAWLNSQSHASWYQRGVNEPSSEAGQAGYPYFSRMNVASRDIDVNNIDRTCYLTISYAPESAYGTSHFRLEGDDRVWWRGDSRRPDYPELTAYSLYVDIDLADWAKQRPLPDEWKEVVEARLERWAKVYSRMLGYELEDVFMLDSGGGAYVMTPPAALSPISQEFDEPEAGRIYKEITQRWRMFTGLLNYVICAEDDAPDNLFSADIVQQKNRQYKIGVHKSLNAVVHPIDPENIDYDAVSLDEVSDELVDSMTDWAKRFTTGADTNHTQAIIEYLFQHPALNKNNDYFKQVETYADPDNPRPKFEFVKGDTWVDILENWLESEADIRRQRMEELEERRKLIERGEVTSDVTDDRAVLDAAIAQVDLGNILRSIAKGWDTDNRSDGTVSFAAPWKQLSGESTSKTSTRCMYDPTAGDGGEPIVYDRGDGWARGVLHIVAWDAGIISHPTDSLSGQKYWDAVDALRKRVNGIPVLVSTDGKMPLRDVIKAGQAMGIIDATEDIEENEHLKYRESKHEEGSQYVDIIDPAMYNKVLDQLTTKGLQPNRDRRDENHF